MSIEELVLEILGLPASARALLAQRLIASLDDEQDAEVDQAWMAEVERRRKEILQGEIVGRPANQAISEARTKLG